ncbi:MAG: hypothetical protein ACO3RV_10135 [Luteolibacter sp.]
MSQLTDFAAAQFAKARTIIGGESVAIAGGSAISCVLNEVSDARGFESGGYEDEVEMEAVVDLVTFQASYAASPKTYRGKTATARGRTFRIESIKTGQSFVTLRLISTERGA